MVHTPERYAQVHRLQEAGGLAGGLLPGRQHSKRQQARCCEVCSAHAPGHSPDVAKQPEAPQHQQLGRFH